MLTIRYITKKSPTTRHEYMGLPEKHMDSNLHEPIWVRPKAELVFGWWCEIKQKRGIHPLTGEQLVAAELLEGGEYNKQYTTIQYAKIIDLWTAESPTSSVAAYALDAYGQKPEPKVAAPPPIEPPDDIAVEIAVEGEDDGIPNESGNG